MSTRKRKTSPKRTKNPLAQLSIDGETVGQNLRNRIYWLENRNRQLKAELKHLRLTMGNYDNILNNLKTVLQTERLPKLKTMPRSRKKKPRVSVNLMLGDWHIGEKVSFEETDGFGVYDYAYAVSALNTILGDFIKWVTGLSSIYDIVEGNIICLGDWISGNIHRELEVTNEFPVPVQVAKAGNLLTETILTLAPYFKKLVIWEVGADNHGRMWKKPQNKQAVLNNYSYLVYTIVNARLAGLSKQKKAGYPNIQIRFSKSPHFIAKILNTRFLLGHGHNVKSWGTYPAYGWQRMLGREALRRMAECRERFDYWVIGHWHVAMYFMDLLIINGALLPTNEYLHMQAKDNVSSQMAFLVSENHGPFAYTIFKVSPPVKHSKDLIITL